MSLNTYRVNVWADSDPESALKSPEEWVKDFIDVKSFFEPELKLINTKEDDKQRCDRDQTPEHDNIIQNNNTQNDGSNDGLTKVHFDSKSTNKLHDFLSKKTDRLPKEHSEEVYDPINSQEGNQPDIGPKPIIIEYKKTDERKMYQGWNINPTEAQLYAKFIQEGKRIPRRGEVGITSQEIQYFESIGYVMSGSRHKKMNAVRQRIEGKVYSAEDKRALAIFNLEENLLKEKNIINGFKYMMQSTNNNEEK